MTASRHAARRIAVNAAIDFALAALAVPLSGWLAAPDQPGLPWPAIPSGAVCLVLAGLPFRLARQHWRFAGPGELLGVAASGVLAAGLFSLGLDVLSVPTPSPAYPILFALCVLVLLGLPRIAYRMLREGAFPAHGSAPKSPVLLAGDNGDLDVFLRALANDPDAPFRPVGLLARGRGQTGRRIQGAAVLGSFDDATRVLARLHGGPDWPEILVVTDPSLSGIALATLLETVEAAGLKAARAPRPTSLAPALDLPAPSA